VPGHDVHVPPLLQARQLESAQQRPLPQLPVQQPPSLPQVPPLAAHGDEQVPDVHKLDRQWLLVPHAWPFDPFGMQLPLSRYHAELHDVHWQKPPSTAHAVT
jgi:hypothetical protein